MRLDELFARIATSVIFGLASGEDEETAIKKGLISSLAHQVKKDVTGIPDKAVTLVESVAMDLVLADKIEKDVTDAVAKFPLLERQAVIAKSNALTNPGIGVTEAEAMRAVSKMHNGISDSYYKLEELKNSVLKR